MTDDERPEGLSEAPHYLGHRERLRERFVKAGADALADYEILELILFRATPRRDVKPLAKSLLQRFGSLAETIAAPVNRLTEIKGLGEAAALEIKIVEAAAKRFAKSAVASRPILSSWATLLDYCRTAMAFAEKENFRILFLDKRNSLIADELQQTGTVDPKPSAADIRMTSDIINIAAPLGIKVHDHIIVGRDGHASFRGLKLIT